MFDDDKADGHPPRLPLYAFLAALLFSLAVDAARVALEAPGCITDTECAELCPAGTRDLPQDHPDHCDGGPQ